MEKNTVILDVKDYNALRDFREKIREGKTFGVSSGNYYYKEEFYTTDEAVKKITEANEILKKDNELIKNENNELKKENNDLRNPKEKEIDVKDLKKMSIWQFYKWRKNSK